MAASLSPGSPSAPEGPIYLAIRRVIEERIATGVYGPGSLLPSENRLAEEFSTTRLTVRNAMSALVEAGVVRRIRGKGTFVAGPASPDAEPLQGFREIVRDRHSVPTVRVISRGRRLAGPLYGELFEVDPADTLYGVRRLNLANDVPISIESAIVPLARVPGVETRDVSVFSLYETYAMDGHAVVAREETLGITRLCARDAAVMHTEPGRPVLTMEVVSFDAQGLAVEHVDVLVLGDRGGYTYNF